MNRRDFLAGVAATAATAALPHRLDAQAAGSIPIIDTHIHLFDPTRPQGAPYSGPRVPGVAPIAAYPDRYRKLAIPLGSVGAVKVEASPWVEDNLWVLEVAQRDTIIVGVIGNLEPDKPEFKEYFDRYRKHPLFRGIRYGNLWGRDVGKQAENPTFIDGLKLLAEADLVLDTANPRMPLLEAMLKISDKVPKLRIVLDHLPGFEPTDAERPAYADGAQRVFQAPADLRQAVGNPPSRRRQGLDRSRAPIKAKLDLLVETFGEDRILFGSDWPNSDGVAPVDQVFGIAKAYFATEADARLQRNISGRNSVAAYKWVKREPSQPSL